MQGALPRFLYLVTIQNGAKLLGHTVYRIDIGELFPWKSRPQRGQIFLFLPRTTGTSNLHRIHTLSSLADPVFDLEGYLDPFLYLSRDPDPAVKRRVYRLYNKLYIKPAYNIYIHYCRTGCFCNIRLKKNLGSGPAFFRGIRIPSSLTQIRTCIHLRCCGSKSCL